MHTFGRIFYLPGKNISIQADQRCLFILSGLSKAFWLKAHNKEFGIVFGGCEMIFDCQFQHKILPF